MLRKVEDIVRRNMDGAGAQEVLLPALQPVELWHKSGRYEDLGEDMVKFSDRHKKELVLGPTHEEVITQLIKNEIRSYKQLPMTFYQIQTKFRDELRPRFGVLRSKEFIMKDAYSFDRDADGLEASYKKMYDAYCRIFEECCLDYVIVEADPGVMGGNASHEFMVLAESGEDMIAACSKCVWASSIDKAECLEKKTTKPGGKELQVEEIDTPNIKTIEELVKSLNAKPSNMLKTIIYKTDSGFIAALIRGDYRTNELKLSKLGGGNLRLATDKEIEGLTAAKIGFSGPVGLKNVKIIADYSVRGMVNFITGANKTDKHLINVNFPRDFEIDEFYDIRFITESDLCPKCKSSIDLKNAIEIGHVFKLGTKYSKGLGAVYLDVDQKEKPMIMGCYGIGINRIIAAIIEQNNDKDGIIWPKDLAPAQISIVVIDTSDQRSMKFACDLENELKKSGLSSLLDDRVVSPGIKFKDSDLIGSPVRVVISRDNVKKGKIEIKYRNKKAFSFIAKDKVLETLLTFFKKGKKTKAKSAK